MCFSKPKPPQITPPAPPPPPPADDPMSPAFNEDSANSDNARVAGNRRGRSSLRIDLTRPAAGGSGLNIPN